MNNGYVVIGKRHLVTSIKATKSVSNSINNWNKLSQLQSICTMLTQSSFFFLLLTATFSVVVNAQSNAGVCPTDGSLALRNGGSNSEAFWHCGDKWYGISVTANDLQFQMPLFSMRLFCSVYLLRLCSVLCSRSTLSCWKGQTLAMDNVKRTGTKHKSLAREPTKSNGPAACQ